MESCDVAVIGGGIVGTSAACFLAEAGASVVLFERGDLAAGASGRNSGVVQHPLDPMLAGPYRRTLELYGELAEADPDFRFAGRPAGLLLVSRDGDAVRRTTEQLARSVPELRPRALMPSDVRTLEPSLVPEVAGCLLETGHPVVPSAATMAFARRARRAGVEIRLDSPATPISNGDRVVGVRLVSGEQLACRQVLLAAGPWTPGLIDSWRRTQPIRPLWGVVAAVALERPPTHVLEELAVGEGPEMPPALFSLVTAEGRSALGSVFLDYEPEPAAMTAQLVARGADFLPEVAGATIEGVRKCARPASFDGRPFVGAVPAVEELFVCSGHGAWGISTGPATAELVTSLMLAGGGGAEQVPPELSALRA